MSAEARGAANKKILNFRTKSGEFEWDGMAPDYDPQDLPPHRPYLMVNLRLESGAMIGRSGMNHLVQLEAGSTVTGMYDHQIGTNRSLMIVGEGCPGFPAGAGFYIGTYDVEQSPQVQRLTYYNTAVNPITIGMYGDDVYFGVDNQLMRLQPIKPPYGVESLSISGVNQDVIVWDLPAGYEAVTAIQEFDGELYVAVLGTVASASAIFRYDGTTFVNDLTGIDPVTGFAVFRELLIAGHGGSPNLIRVRTTAGVWSTVAPGAGTVSMNPNTCASYKDRLYIPSGNDDIFRFDGTTLTRIPAATNGMTAGAVCTAVDIAYGYLFYSWYAPGEVKVGRFDGTTWVPAHKNLTTQFSLSSGTETETCRFYRMSLVVIVTTATNTLLLTSDREDTSGTWTSAIIDTAGVSVPIAETLVY